MAEEFTQKALRLVVARICQPLGWTAMNSNAGHTLADIMSRYMMSLAKTTAAYSNLDNRTESNLVDLSRAFKDFGISLPELAEFVNQVDSTPLDHHLPRYPIPQSSSHVYQSDQSESLSHKKQRSGSTLSDDSSDEENEEYMPHYLPPLPVHKEKERDDDTASEIHLTGDFSDQEVMDIPNVQMPTPLTPHDPLKGLPQLVRPRGFSSDLSEDGDITGSRRCSISGSVPLLESVTDGAPSQEVESGKSLLTKEAVAHVDETEGNRMNVFESAFRKELLLRGNFPLGEAANTEKPAEPVSKLDKSPIPAPVMGKPPPLPPLRPIYSSDLGSFNPQQPPLSPLSRSPRIGQVNLPILSPLKTPTCTLTFSSSKALPAGTQRYPILSSGAMAPQTSVELLPPALKSSPDTVLRPVGVASAEHQQTLLVKPPPISPITDRHALPAKARQISSVTDQHVVSASPRPVSPVMHVLPGKARQVSPITDQHSASTLDEPPTAMLSLSDITKPHPVPESLQMRHVDVGKLPISETQAKCSDVTSSELATPCLVADAEGVTSEEDISIPMLGSAEKQTPLTGKLSDEPRLAGSSPFVNKPLHQVKEDLLKSGNEFTLVNNSSRGSSPERLLEEDMGLEDILSRLSDSESNCSSQDNEQDLKTSLGSILKEKVSDKGNEELGNVRSLSLSSESPDSSPEHPSQLTHMDKPAGSDTEFKGHDVKYEQGGKEQPLLTRSDLDFQGSPVELPVAGTGIEDSNAAESCFLSEDCLSISGNGSESDADSLPLPVNEQDNASNIAFPAGGTEEMGHRSPSPFSDASFHNLDQSSADIEDVLTKTSLSPSAFEEVSAYPGLGTAYPGVSIEGDEIINTSSALVSHDSSGGVDYFMAPNNDSSEKVLECSLSSEDRDVSNHMTDAEGAEPTTAHLKPVQSEGHQERVEEYPADLCLLTTTTEKVKGETKGRKRTVSRDDVLGIKRPKRVAKRKRTGIPINTHPLAIPEATPTNTMEILLNSLMVSIKKSKLETVQAPTGFRRVPSVEDAVPSPPHYDDPAPTTLMEPLWVCIQRRLLRFSKHGLTTPTPTDIRRKLAGVKALHMSSETTPPETRKRELEVSPLFPFNKRPRLDLMKVKATQLSSSSSSSSSEDDDDDSGSESQSHTPSPAPPPYPPHTDTPHRTTSHLFAPSHTPLELPRTPSSGDEYEDDDELSPPTSSVSSVSSVSGGGLKLTISKAVLQQARGKTKPPVEVSRSRWTGGHKTSAAVGRNTGKSQPTKPTTLAPPTSHLLDTPLGKLKPRRGGKTTKKQMTGTGLFVQSSDKITLPPPSFPTPTLGSDTICPKCDQQDDGSPMIGCDNCDDWFHWRCVGITFEPPAHEKWFCIPCSQEKSKKGKKKSRKRKG